PGRPIWSSRDGVWTTGSAPSANAFSRWTSRRRFGRGSTAPSSAGNSTRLINRVQGSAQHVYRRQASVARATSNYYYLLCKPDNEWTVMQNGHCARMRPLDLVLLDSRRCYEFNFPVNADTLSLELPIPWVESWITDPERRIGQRIDGRSGWGAALSAFACQLTPELAPDRPCPAAG